MVTTQPNCTADADDQVAYEDAEWMAWLRGDCTSDYVILHSLGPIIDSVAKILDPGTPPLEERGEGAGLIEQVETLAERFDTLLDR